MAKRQGSARWKGSFRRGSGTVTVETGAFEAAYTAASRFEVGEGTNPEELLGAAHAGCFSMALSLALGHAGHDPETIETEADVHIDKAEDGGFEIHRIDLRTTVSAPGLADEQFQEVAKAAKEQCPVSKALAGVREITLEARLAG